jgi:hypothetical protein
MGSAFECRCNDCGHEFKVVQGGGFSFVHVCCDGCGDTKSLPRFAPREPPEPIEYPAFLRRASDLVKAVASGLAREKGPPAEMSEEAIKAYLAQRPWARRGDRWTKKEEQILIASLGTCPCGGQWVDPPTDGSGKPHALHRCPKCRSRSFKYWYPDIVFD